MPIQLKARPAYIKRKRRRYGVAVGGAGPALIPSNALITEGGEMGGVAITTEAGAVIIKEP